MNQYTYGLAGQDIARIWNGFQSLIFVPFFCIMEVHATQEPKKVEALIRRLDLVARSRKNTACREPIAKPATLVGFCVLGVASQRKNSQREVF